MVAIGRYSVALQGSGIYTTPSCMSFASTLSCSPAITAKAKVCRLKKQLFPHSIWPGVCVNGILRIHTNGTGVIGPDFALALRSPRRHAGLSCAQPRPTLTHAITRHFMPFMASAPSDTLSGFRTRSPSPVASRSYGYGQHWISRPCSLPACCA